MKTLIYIKSIVIIWLLASCNNYSKIIFEPELIPIKFGDKWGYVNIERKYEIEKLIDYYINNPNQS